MKIKVKFKNKEFKSIFLQINSDFKHYDIDKIDVSMYYNIINVGRRLQTKCISLEKDKSSYFSLTIDEYHSLKKLSHKPKMTYDDGLEFELLRKFLEDCEIQLMSLTSLMKGNLVPN